MKRVAICVAVGLLVGACSSSGADPAPTTQTTRPPTTTTATTTTAATTTTTPPTTTTTVAVAAGGCIGCHTDAEALRVLAVEPPATEVLSEGEG